MQTRTAFWGPSGARLILASAVLVLGLLVPQPAQAQTQGQWSLELWPEVYWTAIGAGFFAAAGGVAFLAADVHYAAKRRQLPVGWAVAQVIYGSSFFAVGLLALREEDKGPASTLMAIGGTMAAYPVLDWRIHAGRRTVETSLRLTPTGLLASGTF